MTIRLFACALLLSFGLAANAANTVTTVNQVSTEVTLDKDVDYVITHATPFTGNGKVNITNTDHAVLIIQNIRPSHVLEQKLLDKHVFINGEQAVNGKNCQVKMYAHGTIIMPYAEDIKPLTVFSERDFKGYAVNDFGLEHTNGFMNTLSEEKLNNQIRSFKLKRGYMVTFATGLNGWGYSRCFIADKEDLELAELPLVLDGRISSYRVFQWYDSQKKGIANDTRGFLPELLEVSTCYSFGPGENRLPDMECIPHRIHEGWPSPSECGSKTYSCHLKTNNEPGNSADPDPATVEQVLNNWQELMRTGMRLCSESSHDGSWNHLDQFIAEIDKRGWRCDILDLHCYWASGFDNMKHYYDKYGKRPIWITEWVWGASWNTNGIFSDRSKWDDFSESTQQKNLNEVRNILTTLNNSPYVERYFYWNSERDCSKLFREEGEMSLTGNYYRDMNSGIAYRKAYEKIPNVVYTAPTDLSGNWTSQTLGTFTLNWKDTNGDMLDRILVLRLKEGESKYDTIHTIKPADMNGKFRYYSYTDTLTEEGSYTYNVWNITADGNIRTAPTTVEAVKSNIKGTATFQYGKLSLIDTNPVTIDFTETQQTTPAVFMGTVSNNNPDFYPGNLITSVKRASFTYQLFPWLTSKSTTMEKNEEIPYMALAKGNYQFDTLACEVSTANMNMTDTTEVFFEQPFPDGVTPIVLTEVRNQKEYPISIKIWEVTNTGFKGKLMCENEVGKNSSQWVQVFYMATTPGVGTIDKENGILIAAGKGNTPLAANAFGHNNNFILGADTVFSISPYIFTNLQTTNYDAATMVRLYTTNKRDKYTIGGRFKRIVDSSRKTATDGTTLNASRMTDEMGWVIVYDYVNGVSVPTRIKQIEMIQENKTIKPYVKKGRIYIDAAEQFEVYNIQGKKFASNSILAPGIYIVKTEFSTAMILIK